MACHGCGMIQGGKAAGLQLAAEQSSRAAMVV